jgi:hypothetical protein
MLKGLLELAHGAQTAPAAACSCAKGLAMGVQALASALRGDAQGLAAAVSGRGGAAGANPGVAAARTTCPWPAGAAACSPEQQGRVAGPAAHEPAPRVAFLSVNPIDCGLPAHDAHALRMMLMRSQSGGD